MRLFIALPISNEIKKEILEKTATLKNSNLPISWVNNKNLHITLKFLGEAKNREKIIELLSDIKFFPFKLTFKKTFSFFTKNGYIKTVVLKTDNSKNLNLLFEKIDNSMLYAGFLKEKKHFTPHLTIGRVKKELTLPEGEKLFKRIDLQKLEQTIDTFQLIKSELTPNGAIYTILKEFKYETYK